MFSQEQINELLEQAKPSIVQGLVNDFKKDLTWSVRDQINTQVLKHATEWVKDNVIPEITAQLIESKDSLISLGVNFGPEIVQAVVTSMTDSLKKKLESTYERRAIFESLFK